MTKIVNRIKEKTESIKKKIAKKKPSNEEIAKKAYERFEQRGCCHGGDFDDWCNAEKELRG